MAPLKARTLLLLGAGKMGGALLERWLEQGVVDAGQVAVIDPAPSPQLSRLAAAHPIALNPPIDGFAPGSLSAIILAIKPQEMFRVLPRLKPLAVPETVFLSVAAGTTSESIAKHLGAVARIVRAMPNSPAVIGRGISGVFMPKSISDRQRELCIELLKAVGEVVTLDDERLLDPVTAVSGSGPAYVFLLIECLAAAAADVGLPKTVALTLAKATVAGAGELAWRSDEPPATLRQNVTSPGGTTEAALDILMRGDGLSALLHRAVRAAVERARQLNA